MCKTWDSIVDVFTTPGPLGEAAGFSKKKMKPLSPLAAKDTSNANKVIDQQATIAANKALAEERKRRRMQALSTGATASSGGSLLSSTLATGKQTLGG